MRYVIDSRYFDGVCLTSMRDDVHDDYNGLTLEELRERENNPHLIVITPEQIMHKLDQCEKAMMQPFAEITEERYYDLMDCVPPKRMIRNGFFVGEAYSGNLHDLCFRLGKRYFKALRPITLSAKEIACQINEFATKLNTHPSIVKGKTFQTCNKCCNSAAKYIPYYLEVGGKQMFIRNLCSNTGREFDDARYRKELAGYLLNARKNLYEYLTFYAYKTDIFEFFEWLRKNQYTLEIHGTLFYFAPDRSYVDFNGNVWEYSAAFHYRIYSRELFENIIHQLRRVKRKGAWLRKSLK